MLDCHVLISSDTPRHEVYRCLDSVHSAIDNAGFVVNLHVLKGVPGHIGRARAQGYARGHMPYVTGVDDDDWVEPNAFACLRKALDKNPAAIYTSERRWQNGHASESHRRHHLAVYRRDVVDSFDFEPWKCIENIPLMKHAESMGECIDVPVPVYNLSLYENSKARLLRQVNSDEVRRAYHGC